MNLNHLLFIVLIFILSFSLINENRSQPGILNLEEAEQIRVSLFSLDPPDSLRFSADSANVRIFSDDIEIRFKNIRLDLPISLKNGQLYMETTSEQLPVDSLWIEAKSSTRIITDQYGYRHYKGSLLMKPDIVRKSIRVMNSVDLEDYIASVVGSEMNFVDSEALKAQAVVSRTYALWSVKQSPYPDFDVRDYEANQMYVGKILNMPHYDHAAENTAGEILTWSNQLILAVFSSTCGGITANNEDVWDGNPHPYLRSQQDLAMCSQSPHYDWSHTINRGQLQEMIRSNYDFIFHRIYLDKDNSGRVSQVVFQDRQGAEIQFTGNEFRLYMNRTYGSMAIKSTLFTWEESGDHIIINGKGLGHGVGMCQWGAKGFAENGWFYKDILSFYFSGTKIVNLHDIESKQLPLYQ